MGLKRLAKLFNFVVCNPCQSSPSLTILVRLWFSIISLVFFHLCKSLLSGFLQFKGKFVDGQNTSTYRDRAPLKTFSSTEAALLLVSTKISRPLWDSGSEWFCKHNRLRPEPIRFVCTQLNKLCSCKCLKCTCLC